MTLINNNTENDIVLANGRVVPGSGTLNVDVNNYLAFANDDGFLQSVTDGDLEIDQEGTVINNADVALYFLRGEAVFVHEDIYIVPAAGLNAPILNEVAGGAVIGFEMEDGSVVYAQYRVDNIIGNLIQFQMHMAINNTVADRWVNFDVSYRTSTGRTGGKVVNAIDGTIETGNLEVPTTAYEPFECVANIPVSSFSGDERYLLIKAERKVATGKTAPDNNPLLWRFCKLYWRRLS